MKRALLLSVLFLLSAFGTGKAVAHPLGNFSVNHLTQVEISRDRVDALYILDQAEIPTFQERGLSPAEVLTAQARPGRGRAASRGGRARGRAAPRAAPRASPSRTDRAA